MPFYLAVYNALFSPHHQCGTFILRVFESAGLKFLPRKGTDIFVVLYAINVANQDYVEKLLKSGLSVDLLHKSGLSVVRKKIYDCTL